jgi:lipopolysaccharide biosynthesis protein
LTSLWLCHPLVVYSQDLISFISVDSLQHSSVNAIAFYLPQFHPIPENNEWWGEGFTEWTNVAKSRPLFNTHYQPRIPGDLGFYDLRLSDTRQAQADLAKTYGLKGFCYYHYWFHGHRLLERPIDDLLQSSTPDFPFCLCWANETWSRRWIGDDKELLIEQSYSPEDDRSHGAFLAGIFSDKRYIRVGNRPIFLVYRPGHLPNPQHTLERISTQCIARGVAKPFFVAVDAHSVGFDYRQLGFDDILAFAPQLGVSAPDAFVDRRTISKLIRNLRLGIPSAKLKVFDEAEERQKMESLSRPFPTIPSCFVSWDNSPRRGRDGIIYINSSPELFAKSLSNAISLAKQHPNQHSLLFINAWNEWAEGNYLEPDAHRGHSYLLALRDTLLSST